MNGLKQATLEPPATTARASCSAPRLDAHLDDAGDGIDRHVAAQRDVLTRQIISERQRLIQRAAQLEHNNDDKLAGLAEAHASAAQELARMNGEPEGRGDGRRPLGDLAHRHRPARLPTAMARRRSPCSTG